jgi:choline transport protein
MNYSCVVYGGVIIAGLAYYVFRARKRYVGPSLEIM